MHCKGKRVTAVHVWRP